MKGYLMWCFAFLFFINSVFSDLSGLTDWVWDGSGADDLYMNPANWAVDYVPVSSTRLILNEEDGLVVVQSGDVLTPRKILGPVWESSSTMTMIFSGGSLTNPSYWIVGGSVGGRGIINVDGESCNILTRDLRLGYEGGSALLNLSNGVVEVYGTGEGAGLLVPGDSGEDSLASIKIAGGELRAAQLMMVDGGQINIEGDGRMILYGDQRSLVDSYIAENRIIAEYGGAGVQVAYNDGNTILTSAGGIEHVLVASDPSFFYGWPANEGVWSWGDEIVVGFNKANYIYNPSGHSSSGRIHTIQARSLNGGQDWQIESPAPINTSLVLEKHSEAIDLTHLGFAFKTRNNKYWYSYDKAVTWNGPYVLPGWGWPERGRTDYIVNSSSEMKLFLLSDVSTNDAIKIDRPFCAETTNGCLDFATLNWMCPSPHLDWGGNNYYTMSSTVKIDSDTYISAIRKRDRRDVDGDGAIESADGDINKKYIDIYKTTDRGLTWARISQDVVVNAWNPPSMIKLSDGRICITYGYRGVPKGIRARLSEDDGVTWGSGIILRSDAATWDMGYPRTVQRSDGKVVTMYYYSTLEIPAQHIAATIWTP